MANPTELLVLTWKFSWIFSAQMNIWIVFKVPMTLWKPIFLALHHLERVKNPMVIFE